MESRISVMIFTLNEAIHLPACLASREVNVRDVREVIESIGRKTFDVIVIDGLYRAEMVSVACDYLSSDGVIIADNAEGYDFQQLFCSRGYRHVDFFGTVPGVVLPHATSLFFRDQCFLFAPENPIPVIAEQY